MPASTLENLNTFIQDKFKTLNNSLPEVAYSVVEDNKFKEDLAIKIDFKSEELASQFIDIGVAIGSRRFKAVSKKQLISKKEEGKFSVFLNLADINMFLSAYYASQSSSNNEVSRPSLQKINDLKLGDSFSFSTVTHVSQPIPVESVAQPITIAVKKVPETITQLHAFIQITLADIAKLPNDLDINYSVLKHKKFDDSVVMVSFNRLDLARHIIELARQENVRFFIISLDENLIDDKINPGKFSLYFSKTDIAKLTGNVNFFTATDLNIGDSFALTAPSQSPVPAIIVAQPVKEGKKEEDDNKSTNNNNSEKKIEEDFMNGDEHAISLVRNNRAYIKEIQSFPIIAENGESISYDNKDLDFHLRQIANTDFRPSRALHDKKANFQKGQKILKLFQNPSSQNKEKYEIQDYVIGLGREKKLAKDSNYHFTHTLKTSVALSSSNPAYMTFYSDRYGASDKWVGFLWDSKRCDNKGDRHNYPANAYTTNLFWLSNHKISLMNGVKSLADRTAITTAQTIKNNQQAVEQKRKINWPETLAGLPEKELSAIFIRQNTLFSRLNALRVMYHSKMELNLNHDIPILIFPDVVPYTHEQRVKDVLDILESPKSSREYTILFINKNSDLLLNILISIYHSKQLSEEEKSSIQNLILGYKVSSKSRFVLLDFNFDSFKKDPDNFVLMSYKNNELNLLKNALDYSDNNSSRVDFNNSVLNLAQKPKDELTNQEANKELLHYLIRIDKFELAKEFSIKVNIEIDPSFLKLPGREQQAEPSINMRMK